MEGAQYVQRKTNNNGMRGTKTMKAARILEQTIMVTGLGSGHQRTFLSSGNRLRRNLVSPVLSFLQETEGGRKRQHKAGIL